MENPLNLNENLAQLAFSEQAPIFDALYAENSIIHYKRKRVREHVLQHLKAESKILELNSGTGEDALFFAQRRFKVHATDISFGMQQQLREKVIAHGLQSLISNEKCSFTQLETLQNKGPFNHIFSNFAGLNCTSELETVLSSFSPLLTKDGTVTLVVLPKFCLWETLLLLKGKFSTAFRRFFSAKGRSSQIEGHYFKCFYYQPSFIQKVLKKDFEVLSLEGLCTIVPPSYIEHFGDKYPRLFQWLCKMEDKLKHSWPWRNIGDYYIITLRKRSE